MKALRPTLVTQVLFVLGFNALMVAILFAVDTALTPKLFLAINFSALLIVLNWLPKSCRELDERERLLLLEAQQKTLTVTHVLIALVFAAHLTAFPTMAVTDFMFLVGLPASVFMSWQSVRLRREMN